MSHRQAVRAVRFLGGKGGNRAGFCMAKWIARQLPFRESYIEPFCGMAGVLLNRRRSTSELLNDADHSIVNWWATLRRYPGDLERHIELTPTAEADFIQAKEILAQPFIYDERAPDLDRAVALFRVLQFGIRHSNGRNASFGVSWRGIRYVRRQPEVRALAERLHNVQLVARDALDILERTADESKVVIYCDPPYGGLRDYGAEVDFDRLGDLLEKQQGAVAISGFDDDRDHLGWRRTEVSRQFVPLGRNLPQWEKRVERLWLNFPPLNRLFE